jgi:hypothetical protein
VPLISAPHSLRTTLVRQVEITNGQIQIVNNPDVPAFYASLAPPDAAATPGEAPRQAPPAMLRHASGLTGPLSDLRAGSRVEPLLRGPYEILDNGVEITTGARSVGRQFACLPVDFLYPLDAILSDMDGNPISNMELAIWSASETHDVQAGEYEDYDGEAPIEYAASLQRNVDIMVGTTRYRIIAAETDLDVPRTRLRLRKADEPLA